MLVGKAAGGVQKARGKGRFSKSVCSVGRTHGVFRCGYCWLAKPREVSVIQSDSVE
jgi:hypothetical protein